MYVSINISVCVCVCANMWMHVQGHIYIYIYAFQSIMNMQDFLCILQVFLCSITLARYIIILQVSLCTTSTCKTSCKFLMKNLASFWSCKVYTRPCRNLHVCSAWDIYISIPEGTNIGWHYLLTFMVRKYSTILWRGKCLKSTLAVIVKIPSYL